MDTPVQYYRLIGIALLPFVGCDHPAPSDASSNESAAPPALAVHFEAATAGTITGGVRWTGPIPDSSPISGALLQSGSVVYKQYPRPNALDIDPQTRAVRGAVVFLEAVEPERSRPWDHGPVRVEIHEDAIRLVQDGQVGSIGFVHRGDEVEMVSRDPALHVLSVRGAAFFALPFPDPERPLRRRFDRPGLVELSSGAARYWQQGYLWVCDHPYFALTGADGRFTLEGVPPGEYGLVAWHPNSDVAATDRDPNTGMILRYHFAPAIERRQTIRVASGHTTEVDCALSK